MPKVLSKTFFKNALQKASDGFSSSLEFQNFLGKTPNAYTPLVLSSQSCLRYSLCVSGTKGSTYIEKGGFYLNILTTLKLLCVSGWCRTMKLKIVGGGVNQN